MFVLIFLLTIDYNIIKNIPFSRPSVTEQVLNSNVANPSIGEVSLGASLSMGSGI